MQPELLPAAAMSDVVRAGETLAEAVSLQFQELPSDERQVQIEQLLESHGCGDVNIDDSRIILDAGRVVGVLLLVAQNDGTIYVWPAATDSRIPPYDATRMRRELYAAAVRVVDESGVWIAQSLLESTEEETSLGLSDNGFPKLTSLLFMNRSLDIPVPPTVLPPDCRLISFDAESDRGRYARTIERTYVGTLDCPELNGCRNGEQSLLGHRRSGIFDPSRWLLLTDGDVDAGLLLLTEHPEDQVWEVVYVGLVPEVRGRGLGRLLLLEGLHRAQQARALEVVLAVDERNDPAIALYEGLDFTSFERRLVHARLPVRSPDQN